MTGAYRARAVGEKSPPSQAAEFQFALSEEAWETLDGFLKPPEGHHLHGLPERGAIGIITPSTGDRRTTYLLQKVVEPGPGDVYFDGQLKFHPDYTLRAINEAAEVPGAGLIFIHTHPGSGATPSGPDKIADKEELYDIGLNLGSEVPLAAGIVTDRPNPETGQREWSVRAYEFVYPNSSKAEGASRTGEETGEFTHATAVRVVGERIKKLPTIRDAAGPAGTGGAIDSEAQDSTVELWGERGQQTLAGFRVGVVGLGGVGSLLAEQLARLGVEETVFVDFDYLERANLNRSYGATADDVGKPKVEVAKKVAERSATNPRFTAQAEYGSVVEEDEEHACLPQLLDCDVIINAADTHWVRFLLDEVSHAHLIPVLDGGTELIPNDEKDELDIGSGSLVSATGPGHPCLECTGHWFHGDEEEGVIHDREPDAARGAGYVQGLDDGEELADDGEGDERAPSVATNNGLVASLLALRFQALAVGITSQALVGSQEYDALFGTVDWQEDSNNEKRISCKEDCARKEALARGDHYELPTEPDPTFRKVLEEHREGDQQRETAEPDDEEQTERGVFQRITAYVARLVNRSSKESSQ